MRYLLIENAIVSSDEISNFKNLKTDLLFTQKNEHFCEQDYLPVFKMIKEFLPDDSASTEIFVATHFYLIPCFVLELQHFLGDSVTVLPIRALFNETRVREIYDYHIIDTVVNQNDSISIDVKKDDIMEKVKGKKFEEYLEGGSLSGIVAYNKKMKGIQHSSYDNITMFYVDDDSYKCLLTPRDGYSLFSPYASLLFYEEALPGAIAIEGVTDRAPHVLSSDYSFRLNTIPDCQSFKGSLGTWALAEKNHNFTIERSLNETRATGKLSILDSFIAETELQVQNLHFGKFYLELTSDFLGQLHVRVSSLNNKVYYDIIQF